MERARSALEGERDDLNDELHKVRTQAGDLGKKKHNLEAQLNDAQARLKEATARSADFQTSNTKLQVSTFIVLVDLFSYIYPSALELMY